MELRYKILHNPRCRKSREALNFLKSIKIEFETIFYLKDSLKENEIRKIIDNSNLKIEDFIRKQETLWKYCLKNKILSKNEIINILVNNPILIQRPIFFSSLKSVIAIPPEKVYEVVE